MPRTSRTAPTVDALDNLDLDDMFAGDDVALFDGLDLDLDNMDDIAGMDQGGGDNKASAAPPTVSKESQQTQEEEVPKRRKAKRKTKAPFYFGEEDDDYDEPKKKRASKATTKKKKGGAKASAANNKEAKAAATKGSKAQKRTSATMPPPTSRGSVASVGAATVAAAGQFGGRQKRGSATSFAGANKKQKLTKADAATKRGSKSSSPIMTAAAFASASAAAAQQPTLQQLQALHAQPSFCGLLPSNTLFYPFMPSLPTEPTINNRKVYPLIDRINSSFGGHLSAGSSKDSNGSGDQSKALPIEPIFQLLESGYKETKPNKGGSGAAPVVASKTDVVGNSIGALRRTISNVDKSCLAGDLYAVAALLKRQHDFLKQNAANMERWCKENFNEADFSAVYVPPNKDLRRRKSAESLTAAAAAQVPVLSTFDTAILKVKVSCAGFKAPKTPVLYASLPPYIVKISDASASKTAKGKVAKRKLSLISDSTTTTTKKVTKAATGVREAPPTYAQMHPNRRRKNVTDMLIKTAREIESRLLVRADERQGAAVSHQENLEKLVEKDTTLSMHMNTTGMWKWIESSGYFGHLTQEQLNERLGGVSMPGVSPSEREEELPQTKKLPTAVVTPSAVASDESVIDRLQSLLVEEDMEGEEMMEHGDDVDDEVFTDLVEETNLADLSDLSLDERLRLVLRSAGLVTSSEGPQKPLFTVDASGKSESARISDARDDRNVVPRETARDSPPPVVSDELGLVIDAMTDDLWSLNSLNNRRIAFLKSNSSLTHSSASEIKLKADEEASLVAKCQQLLRKTKESKVKNGKAKAATNDVNALPW